MNNNNTINNNTNNKRRHYHNNSKNKNRQRFQPERLSINKVYDSNGPTGRQRGTASTLYEKYTTLARDSHSSGDRVLSESLMQHAEHYLRIINSIQEQMQNSFRETYHEAQTNPNSEPHDDHESHSPTHQNDGTSDESFESTPYNLQQPPEMSEPQVHEKRHDQSDKPILRRKSFPYSRRRSFDHTQGQNSPQAYPASSSEASDLHRAPSVAETVEQVFVASKTPETSTIIPDTNTNETDNTVKRRVVRRRIVAKPNEETNENS